ncbi:MAG: hypothetical protein AB8B85_21210 [Paracoccaceae bacterium]
MDFHLIVEAPYEQDLLTDIVWECINDDTPSGRQERPWRAGPRASGPDGTVAWTGAEFGFVGHHLIVCRFVFAGEEKMAEYPVQVVTVGEMLPTRPVHSDVVEEPETVLRGLEAQNQIIEIMDASLPGPEESRERFEERMEKSTDTAAHLRSLLESSQGKARYPIFSQYYSARNASPRDGGTDRWQELRVFLTEWDTDCWALIDWTDPKHTQTSGDYDGIPGFRYSTPEEAIDGWDSHNSYPVGIIRWEYDVDSGDRPPHPIPDRAQSRRRRSARSKDGHFETDEASTLDAMTAVLDWIALGGAVVAGTLTLIAPVPGARVVSGVIWGAIYTSLAAGTASSALRIAGRAEDDRSNLRDDGLDVLTIAANLLGAGAAVRTSAAARAWAQGAVVTSRSLAITRGVAIGAFTSDIVQGVIVAEEQHARLRQVLEDDSIHADERLRSTVRVVGELLASGALLVFNFRATRADLNHLNQPNRHLPPETTPQDRLNRLADENDVVELDPRPRGEGNTSEGRHRTHVETAPAARHDPDEATTRRAGDVTTPTTNRSRERPYHLPEEHYVARPGQPLPELDRSKRYLWAVDPDGNVIVAPERQPSHNRASEGVRARSTVKHRDLLPNPDGQPGPGRAGGELNWNAEAGEWIMDNNSSMTFARGDGSRSTSDNLDAVYELLRQSGTNMENITYSNTHGAR